MVVNGVDIDIQKIKDDSKDKYEAMRKVRELTGATLIDAKNAVEQNIESGESKLSIENSFYQKLKTLPGADTFGTRKEIKHLQKIIRENEEVFAIASGIMDGNTWLIACTNQRIAFIDCGMIYGVKHSEVMINKVNGISYKNGLLLGEIHIEDGASTRIIRNVQKYSTKPFVDAVHRVMDLSRKAESEITNQVFSNADELLKFKQLLDMGIITQDEFEKQKGKLLS